ncbi:hypothetical protein CA54_54110 [Symmachiella macrocystis]|uniref:Tetratricopeptide repeat protein n=1 Tax=Symmachiella macrocystis TaxID=2527985 RepID=A0A5C6B5H5_9PLAN|nr:hypothetical protein [Symmachiella macrocystis]TWU07007.1 hypothetical protein CA54_54110 [Symmachiella macrocystis]
MEDNRPCEISHRQILQGNCPLCGVFVRSPSLMNGKDDEINGDCVWDAAAMRAALKNDDETVHWITIRNLQQKTVPLQISIPLLSQAIGKGSERTRDSAEDALWKIGTRISKKDVRKLEDQLSCPDNELAIRIVLLVSYLNMRGNKKLIRLARLRSVFWIIENAPECNTAGSPYAFLIDVEDSADYEKAKQLWLGHVEAHGNNLKILGNASQFFTLRDKTLSEKLLKRGRVLDPSNPEWTERLGQLYSLGNCPKLSGHTQGDSAHKALEHFQAADEIRRGVPFHGVAKVEVDAKHRKEKILIESAMTLFSLCDLTNAAIKAGEFQVAREYATKLLRTAHLSELPEGVRQGQPVFDGNLALGWCALKEGDVDLAKNYLIAAAHTKGSPTLNSFGPDMSLAKALMERGERAAVLEFLELCTEFWKMSGTRHQQWIEDVKHGNIPDF